MKRGADVPQGSLKWLKGLQRLFAGREICPRGPTRPRGRNPLEGRSCRTAPRPLHHASRGFCPPHGSGRLSLQEPLLCGS